MAKLLVAAVLLANCAALPPLHADDLVDLSRLLLQANNYWPEGAMECEVSGVLCRVNGADQSYKVRAYWNDDRYRYEFDSLIQNGQIPSDGWVVIGGGEGFRYLKVNGTALVSRTADTSKIEDHLKVLPSMSWLNVQLDETFLEWVRRATSNLDHSIAKASDGSYRLFIRRDGIDRTTAEFTSDGLPTLLHDVSPRPGARARISRFEWLDVDGEEYPRPVKLVQGYELANGKKVTLLEIVVSEFRPKLKPTDPSLAVPPVDLPAGIPIHDMR
jgi:hypothetical protein